MKSHSNHKNRQPSITKKARQHEKFFAWVLRVATTVVTILRIILEILHYGHSIGLW